MSTPKKETPALQIKAVKHSFTEAEFAEMCQTLAGLHDKLTNLILEKKQIAKSYSAREAEYGTRIASLSTDVRNTFEMREEQCKVLMFPKERKKRFWLANDDPKKVDFVLEEEMDQSDYQPELVEVDFKLDKVERIDLFTPTETGDYAFISIGTARKLWFATLSAKVGDKTVSEPLTAKTPASVKRYDSVKRAAGRFQKWASKELGKDLAKGFEEPASKAVESHSERVE